MERRANIVSGADWQAALFVIRCAGAAAIAFEMAAALGLAEASWAAISAIIVSQDQLHDTISSLGGRILGTMLGIAVTLAVHVAIGGYTSSIILEMGVSVAISALVVRHIQMLRVAMWTCPILLLPSGAAVPMATLAGYRGGEVILGALVGWAVHGMTEWSLRLCKVGCQSADDKCRDSGRGCHGDAR